MLSKPDFCIDSNSESASGFMLYSLNNYQKNHLYFKSLKSNF